MQLSEYDPLAGAVVLQLLKDSSAAHRAIMPFIVAATPMSHICVADCVHVITCIDGLHQDCEQVVPISSQRVSSDPSQSLRLPGDDPSGQIGVGECRVVWISNYCSRTGRDSKIQIKASIVVQSSKGITGADCLRLICRNENVGRST